MVSKVLHIIESFDGQAIEKWLTLLVTESVKRGNRVNWSFYCIEKNAGRYSEQLAKLGCEVICSPYPISRPVKFIKALREIVRAGGYDIIHSHHDLMSAVYFVATLGLPVRKRIIHIHNTSLSLPTKSRTKQYIGKTFFRFICNRLADHIVGVSKSALISILNGNDVNEKCSIIHCAIDVDSSIQGDCHGHELRRSLGIPASALILLFVGRMTAYKNPAFVIEILGLLRQQGLDVYGVFVGKGDQIEKIVDLSAKEGIGDRVKCLGWRNDVREIMAASDVLIFPSIENPMEGLGLSVVEAQSVGLPVVMSLSVPEEAIVIPELVERLSLQAGAKVWSNKITNLIRKRASYSRDEYENIIKQSSFSPYHSLSGLVKLYQYPTDVHCKTVDDLPNFIVIGSSKCGTTSLHAYLSMHPKIYLPKQKELHFFQDDKAAWGTWCRGLAWYSSMFSGSSAYLARGECSPGYSHEDQSEIAARKMYETLPLTKIVYMIRDPIERVRSHYIEEVANRHLPEDITLNEIISAGADGEGIANHFFKVIIQSTLYHRQLKRYLNYFPLSNIHVIALEDLVANPQGELEKLFEFLGVYQDFTPPNIANIYNAGAGKRIRVYNPTAFFRRWPGYEGFSKIFPDSVRNKYRRVISKSIDKRSKCSISPANLQFLEALFRVDVSRLSELLGREFSGWSR
ncbi:MAG: hypothetical protein A3J49_18090 [Gallionellales bacterium RIFCSPHIGHO2_02_FULL_57_16]|nr:MAG: hypothetical protein A3J49_18090 [Gallionellales bacterium RIFCSPHIGHO2_02_FULL_57_16]